mgnify:CR=1 FL=1
MLQYSMRDALAALRRDGWKTDIIIEDKDHEQLSSIDVCRRVLEVDPVLVILIYAVPLLFTWGVVAGAGLHALIQVPGLVRCRARYLPAWRTGDRSLARLLRLMGPRILILGSLPSERSIAEHQYYAHPQNAFWRIMQALFGIDGEYANRCRQRDGSVDVVHDPLFRFSQGNRCFFIQV